MSDTAAIPVRFSSADGGEELARAELYGLLAQLWIAPPDEALLQQFGQSATNDFVWQSARPAFRGTAFDLAASLDNWRDDREVRLRQTALQAQGDVPHLAEKLLATRQVQQDPRLQRALRDLQELRGDEVDTVKLQRALGDVAHHARQAGDAAANVGPLMRRIETALQSMEQREASLRWRAPAHRRDAASPTPN